MPTQLRSSIKKRCWSRVGLKLKNKTCSTKPQTPHKERQAAGNTGEPGLRKPRRVREPPRPSARRNVGSAFRLGASPVSFRGPVSRAYLGHSGGGSHTLSLTRSGRPAFTAPRDESNVRCHVQVASTVTALSSGQRPSREGGSRRGSCHSCHRRGPALHGSHRPCDFRDPFPLP